MDVAMVSDVNIRDAVIWPRDQIAYKGRILAIWKWSFHAMLKTCPGNKDRCKRLESQLLKEADH